MRVVTDAEVEEACSHRWHPASGKCVCGGYFVSESDFIRHVLEAVAGVSTP